MRLLKEMCVSGERGRGAALGVVVAFDVDGFDVEGLGLGVAPAGGGGGGRADIVTWFLGLMISYFLLVSLIFPASWRVRRRGIVSGSLCLFVE